MKRWSLNHGGAVPKISVVAAVYNKARDLGLCLEGYLRQSFRDFELILADDGSELEIEEICRRFGSKAAFPVTYLWQPDRGWGKPRMLNWSVLEARAENIVFTDGDCIPHPHFVRAHSEEAREGVVQCGRRVDLMEKISPVISAQDVSKGRLDSLTWMTARIIREEVDFGWQGFYLPRFLARTMTAALRKPA